MDTLSDKLLNLIKDKQILSNNNSIQLSIGEIADIWKRNVIRRYLRKNLVLITSSEDLIEEIYNPVFIKDINMTLEHLFDNKIIDKYQALDEFKIYKPTDIIYLILLKDFSENQEGKIKNSPTKITDNLSPIEPHGKINDDWLVCGKLKFNKITGDFIFNKTKGIFALDTQEFNILLKFLESENNQVKNEDLIKIIRPEEESKKIDGWATYKWPLDYVLRNIKTTLGILPERKAKNKNIFKCLRKWKGYRMLCD